jgi:hypothetical protein
MAEENPPSRAETGRSSEDRIVKSATEARLVETLRSRLRGLRVTHE